MTDERKASPEEEAEYHRRSALHHEELLKYGPQLLVDIIMQLESSDAAMHSTIERQRGQMELLRRETYVQMEKDCRAICALCAQASTNQKATLKMGRYVHVLVGKNQWVECAANFIRLYWRADHPLPVAAELVKGGLL